MRVRESELIDPEQRAHYGAGSVCWHLGGQEVLERLERAPRLTFRGLHTFLDGRRIEAVGREARQVLRQRQQTRPVRRPEAMRSAEQTGDVAVGAEGRYSDLLLKDLAEQLDSRAQEALGSLRVLGNAPCLGGEQLLGDPAVGGDVVARPYPLLPIREQRDVLGVRVDQPARVDAEVYPGPPGRARHGPRVSRVPPQ